MRKVFAVAMMTAMVGAVGFSQSAEAGVTYDYVFRSTDINGNPIAGGTVGGNGMSFTFSSLAAANDACEVCGSGGAVMDIFLRTTDNLIAASVSVMWDDSNGLRIGAAAQEWFGQGITFNMMNVDLAFAPFAGLDCSGAGTSDPNTCQSFDGSLLPPNGPPSLPAGVYNIGTIIWDTSTLTDANGLRNTVMTFVLSGIDGTGAIIGGNTVDLSGTEELAIGAINIVPEPATAGLLALGLAGLVLAGRRRSA